MKDKDDIERSTPLRRNLPYSSKLKKLARFFRKHMPSCERKIWFNFLINVKPHFRRQHPIDKYIVDFYCPERKLVIEIDGDSHYTDKAKAHDEQRAKVLEKYGLKVVRVCNLEIIENFDNVCDTLSAYLDNPSITP